MTTTLPSPSARLQLMAAQTIRRLCPIPERMTVTEWADRYRILPETSTAPGPYRSSVVPYQRRPQDLMGDPSVSMLALCWASQTGKSTVIEHGIGYRIHKAPGPMILLRPKTEDAEGWVKERFVPMVLATPVLRERVRLGRPTDSTLRYKGFPGGYLYVPSAQSATELASRSAPVVYADEVDRMEVIPGEGNPVKIITLRQAAADIGLFVAASTPRLDETTLIWPYLEDGTYELYEVPCPHCGTRQALRWAQVKWPRGKPLQAEYACAKCDRLINERAKPALLAAGDWAATNAEGRYPSFHLNALYSPFGKSGWGTLADEFERAHGKPADLQVFVNTRLAELWSESDSNVSPNQLLERLEPMTEGVVPVGVGAITVGVDIQDNRIEVSAWGWGAGLESWLIAHWILPGDTSREPGTPGSVWKKAEEVLRLEFVHTNGGHVPIAAGFVDSGHHMTKVYRFVATFRRRHIFASKGVGGAHPILGKPTLQTKQRHVLYPIGVDALKSEFLRGQIHERTEGPGYVHLGEWLTTDQLAQLVAEERKRRIHRGKVTYEWRRKGGDAPNELLDCRNYARAALELLGPKVIARLDQRAEILSKPVAPADPDAEAGARRRAPAKPPASWAQRWRQ